MTKYEIKVTKQSAEDNPGRRWYDKGASYSKNQAKRSAAELSKRYHMAQIKGVKDGELVFHFCYQDGQLLKTFKDDV